MARCSICGTLIKNDEGSKSCPECQQDYHEACWEEIGGCATYGCKSAAQAEKPPPPLLVGGGWGDDKQCPDCDAKIPSSRLVCRCGALFPWADPMTRSEYRTWHAQQAQIRSTKQVIATLFVLSLSGVLAPITGLMAILYGHKRRQMLLGADGTYLAMAYGSAAIGGIYLVILGLLGLGL